MRREADNNGCTRRLSETLLDLRHMAVPADAVGVDTVLHLGEQDVLTQRPPAPVTPDFASTIMFRGSTAPTSMSGTSGAERLSGSSQDWQPGARAPHPGA